MQRDTKGFTLIEVVVTLTILVIVVTLATPSGQKFLANQRASGQSRAIYNAIQLAKVTAIKEGRSVTISFWSDEDTPVSDASNSLRRKFKMVRLEWDENGDGAIGSDERELAVSVTGKGGVECDTNQNTISYNSRGLLFGSNQGTIATRNAYREYRVVLNILGTIRQENVSL